MSGEESRRLGRWGEDLAAAFLEEKGCRIVDRNWKCRFGELDLVAEGEGYLCFVEVKLRTRGGTEAGQAAVTPLKRRRMAEAARCYLGAHPEHAGRCVRFDVVTVTAEGMRHVPDAFSGCEW